VEQQRFVVSDEKVVELEVELRDVDTDSVQVRGNFVDPRGHDASLPRLSARLLRKCHDPRPRYTASLPASPATVDQADKRAFGLGRCNAVSQRGDSKGDWEHRLCDILLDQICAGFRATDQLVAQHQCSEAVIA